MFHRYHHLGENLVALYYTGRTGLAIVHGDGQADSARVPVKSFGRGYQYRLYMQMAMFGCAVWLVHQRMPMRMSKCIGTELKTADACPFWP